MQLIEQTSSRPKQVSRQVDFLNHRPWVGRSAGASIFQVGKCYVPNSQSRSLREALQWWQKHLKFLERHLASRPLPSLIYQNNPTQRPLQVQPLEGRLPSRFYVQRHLIVMKLLFHTKSYWHTKFSTISTFSPTELKMIRLENWRDLKWWRRVL